MKKGLVSFVVVARTSSIFASLCLSNTFYLLILNLFSDVLKTFSSIRLKDSYPQAQNCYHVNCCLGTMAGMCMANHLHMDFPNWGPATKRTGHELQQALVQIPAPHSAVCFILFEYLFI